MEVSLSKSRAATPTYDRGRLTTRIVHLGFGAFHRAHQAVYADHLADAFESDWGYAAVNLVGGEQHITDLTHQNLLFTVAKMSPARWSARVVGVIKQALHIEIDGVEAILALLCEPQIAIVSLTITEKGYCHSPAEGELQLQHPMIAADLANPQQPNTAPGVIVAALARRRAAGLAGFSILSCDNMPDNGRITHRVIQRYAGTIDPDLAVWIDENVSFPSTMVDRIVPAVTAETLDKIAHLTGVRDPVAVACEPFRQWVIEDHFVAGRPAWEKVGAQLVGNVLPFEEMKLRMLNGSHSFLAYLGYLAGYQTVHDCMQDDAFRRTAHALMLNEQAPTLAVQGVDLPRYADQLIERYSNPELHHRTFQIAMDGSLKLPQRMLDSIRWHLAHHSRFDLLALGVAAWMRYVDGIDEQGQPIDVNDPLLPLIQAAMNDSQKEDERVDALLGIKEIFGSDLCHSTEFKQALVRAYHRLRSDGAKQTVKRYANALNCEI